MKGNNDLLVLTQPATDRRDPRELSGGRRRHHRDQHVQRAAHLDGRLRHGGPWPPRSVSRRRRLARAAADAWTAKTPDQPRIVAGALGPTNRTASISPDVNNPGFRNVSFDELRIAYLEQAKALIEGGADVLLIETVFDTLNAKAAGVAVLEAFDETGVELPLLISGTITDRSGRTLSGQTPEAFWYSMRHLKPFAVGLNCALGAEAMRPYIAEIAAVADTYVLAYPNAGLPNAMGEYDETPHDMSCQIEPWAEEGLLNIVGGCCGSTPEHIAEIRAHVSKHPPRRCRSCSRRCGCAGSSRSCMGKAHTS